MDRSDSPVPDWKQAAAREYEERRAEFVRQRDKGLKAIERMQRRLQEIEVGLSDLDKGAKAFGLPVAATSGDAPTDAPSVLRRPAPQTRRRSESGPQFKDVALDFLAQAYPQPRKAAEVQEYAEQTLRREFHWKTSGMTLYRLSKEGLVARSGQNWFWVPPQLREMARAESTNDSDDDAEFDAVVSAVEEPAPRSARWSELFRGETADLDPEDFG